jgi:hypothetical protein
MRKQACLAVAAVAFFLSAVVAAQEAALEWEKTFTTDARSNASGNSVQAAADGGFVVAGRTNSTVYYPGAAPRSDVYLVKTDAQGAAVWSRTLGGNGDAVGRAVLQTADGGYAIAGDTDSAGAGGRDVYLVKTDAAGILEWEKTFGGPDDDYGYALRQTADGGFVIAGCRDDAATHDKDIYLVKTDAAGALIWEKSIDFSDRDCGYALAVAPDGGFVIAGEATPAGAYYPDICLVKTDAAGNELWRRLYGADGDDIGRSIEPAGDGYIVAGVRFSHYVHLMKIDAAGALVWERTYTVSGSRGASAVKPTADGGYILAGTAEAEAFLLKTDGDGYESWRKMIGARDFAWQKTAGSAVIQTPDQGYLLAGQKATDWTIYSSIGQIPIYSLYLARIGAVSTETPHEDADASDNSNGSCFISAAAGH